jgi:hypothetical protein
MSWVRVGWLCLALLIVVGCRTSQPHLEPPKERETLNIPPIDDARYNRAEYPQAALASGKKDRRLYEESQKDILKAGGAGFGPRPGGGMNGGF